MNASVLIADDFHPALMEKLEMAGISFSYEPELTRQGILAQLESGTKCLVIRSKTNVDQQLLKAGKNLKLVARGGAGMDNIDTETADTMGIVCVNAGEANSDAVGEQTIGMLLSLLHNIAKSDAEVRKNIWDREGNRGNELNGKTVGIIGYGNTGSAVARKLLGFGVQVLAYDKFKKGFSSEHVKESTLDEIFELADIVTFHIPLDRHTKNIINSDFLQQFVRNIFLLNLSRGGILNTRDVLKFLNEGKILGFGADVLENENPVAMGVSDRIWFDELIQKKNVVLTPHIGGWSVQSYEKISQVLAEKIIRKSALL